MKVALVHDWLIGLRGGERVLGELAGMFPQADVYTLIHRHGTTLPEIDRLRVHASPLSRLPGAARHHRKLLPLFPWAIGRFRLTGYDLVLSVNHAVAQGVPVAPGTPHVCYCLTPMRWVWDQADAYLGTGWTRRALAPAAAWLRRWDVARSRDVGRFIAISSAVAERVKRHYGRDASVVHPPVDVERFRPSGKPHDGFFLLVGAFVPYKREALAIEAFRGIDAELVVAGDGPGRERCAADAPANVRFLGRVSDDDLADLYARCRALVYPQLEDFGLVAVEAQAAGRPVIAFGAGGALDTVVPHGVDDARAPTGIWFDRQTPASLASALERFVRVEADFDAQAIRRHAERFARPRFRERMARALETPLD